MYLKIVKIFSILFVLLPNILQATVYYVDNTIGNDSNTGSESQPWKTIQKAANTLVAGDTVYIKAGNYAPTQKIEFLNSGIYDNYINYLAYPGDEHLVIVDGTNVSLPNWYGIFTIISKNYIKISGLKLINSSYAGFYVDLCTNILIENNHTYQTQSSGISVWDSDLIVIDNNEVSRACWPTGGMQECISIVISNRVLVKNNHVFDGGSIGFGGGGEGIDLKDGCTNSIVENNIVHDIASVGIYIDAYETNQSNIKVSNNLIYNIYGVGMATVSEQGGALENVSVSKNIVYNCEDRGMVIHWTNKPDYIIKNIYVQHNTFYNNGEGLDIGVHTLGENIHITNNIFSQNLVYQMQYSSTDLNVDELYVKNNLLDGINPSWALFGEDYILDNPEFIDVSTNDFQLQGTSPAINQGAFLTQTINSGTGTTIEVENGGYFSNGYGIKQGDLIQIEGQNQYFEIVAIDYLNNTLTLNEPTSWNEGEGVSLAFNADVPDIGAYEYNSSTNIFLNTIENLILFPNPTRSTIYIPEKHLNKYYEIISIDGSLVQKGKINLDRIDVSEIESGVYILKISDVKSGSLIFSKFVKSY